MEGETMTSDKAISAINAAKSLIKIALQDTSVEQFDLTKARQAAPSYWSSLDLEHSKDKIQSILNTKADPHTDQFYKAVFQYQQSNPRITMKDGILGPETLSAMMRDQPDLVKNFQATPQSSDFNEFLDKNQGQAEGKESFDIDSFKQKIGRVESGGDYSAVSPHTSATGKYQFIWSIWSKPIAQFAGRSVSREEFLSNPKLQDAFMDYYTKSSLVPSAMQLRRRFPEVASKLTPHQLMGLVHFKGPGDAAKILSGLPDPTTKNNLPVQQYLAKLV